MIWRLFAWLRAVLRDLRAPSEFSKAWHAEIDRITSRPVYEGRSWNPKQFDEERFRPARRFER